MTDRPPDRHVGAAESAGRQLAVDVLAFIYTRGDALPEGSSAWARHFLAFELSLTADRDEMLVGLMLMGRELDRGEPVQSVSEGQ